MLAALVAVLVVAAAWWGEGVGERAPRAAQEPVLDVPVAIDAPTPVVELASADLPPAVRRAVMPPTARLGPTTPITTGTAVRARRAVPPVGRLVVRAVDAVTGQPIRSPRVRAASATRFAEWPGLSTFREETSLRLTPGDYELHVGAPGYEPTEGTVARVGLTETTTLEPISLRPGSGRIVGRADGVRSDELIRVELRGDGRLACGDCTGRPCARCGWAPEHSRRALGPTGEFAFERLASGAYLVRFVDDDEREVGAPIRIDLAVGEARRAEITVARPRSVMVALIDVDGTPLDGAWSDRRADAEVDPEVEVVGESGKVVRGVSWSCRFLEGSTLVAQGEFTPPPPLGVEFRSYRSSACRTSRTLLHDDRERRPEDELRPTATIPALGPAHLAPIVDDRGLVRFRDVPARARVLEMRCGTFTAVVPIDDGVFDIRRAQIERNPQATSGPASYLAFESGRDD